MCKRLRAAHIRIVMCVRVSVRVFMTRCTRFYQQIIRALLTTYITLHGEHISIYADDTRVSYNLLQGLNEGICIHQINY